MAGKQSPLEEMVINNSATQRSQKKHYLKAIIGALIAVIFVYLFIRKINVDDMMKSLALVPYQYLLYGLLALAIAYYLRAFRWYIMLRAFSKKIRPHNCVGPFVLSMAFNNVLPFRAGDIFRIFMLKDYDIKKIEVLGTIVLERIFDVLTLLGMFFCTIHWMTRSIISIDTIRLLQFAAIAVVILLLGILLLPKWFQRFLKFLESGKLGKISLCRKIFALAHDFLSAILLIRSFKRFVQIFLISIVAWTFEAGIFVAAALGCGYHGNILGPFFATATGTLATAIPSTPGYIGTFDYFAMTGLRAFGADSTVAGAFAILSHLFLWLPVTCGGFLYYFYNHVLKSGKKKSGR